MAKTPAAASAKAPTKSVGKATPPATALIQPKALAPIKATPVTKPRPLVPKLPVPELPVPELPASAIKRLEAECVQLAKSLKDSQARIADLERQRDNALDRIEWVIDSLHSLREGQG